MTFYDVSFEEPEDGKFSRVDLQPYRDFMEKLQPGQIATVTVDTGDVYKTAKGKLRGREESADERAFRKVAQEQNIGLRITHKLQQGGTTRLRIMKQPKRQFSQETLEKRKEALAKTREAAKRRKEAEGQIKNPQQPNRPANPPQKRQG